MTGVEKRVFIKAVDRYVDFPTKLTGSNNWYYQASDDIIHAGSSTLSLRYHSKLTKAYFADPELLYDSYAVILLIKPYLIDRGYVYISVPF